MMALMPARAHALVGHRRDGDELGVARVGDEDLRAVDDPLAVLEHRGGLGAAGVGTGLRLGQAEGADALAAAEQRAGTSRFCSSVPNR